MRKLKTAANRLGFSVGRHVDAERQHRLFESLWPYETEHKLIRLGGDRDGGYLIPDDLAGISACFSPGVSDQSSFENDILALGIKCYQADASVESSPVGEHPLVEFERKFLGPATEGQYVTLSDWIGEKDVTGDLLLQMDIEGDEWLVFSSTPDDVLQRFRILCVEFHGLQHIFDPFAFAIMERVFQKLTRIFEVVHIHANNWCESYALSEHYRVPGVLEYTFHRKDRVKRKPRIANLPHPLDHDCRPDAPSVSVPRSLLGL